VQLLPGLERASLFRRSFIRRVPKWLEVNSVECSFGKNGNCGDTSSQFLVATKKVETNFGIFFEERREKNGSSSHARKAFG